jgi:hypothetical protein
VTPDQSLHQPVARPSRLLGVARLVLLGLLALAVLGMLGLTGQRGSSARLVSDLQEGRTQHVLVLDDRVVWRDGAVRNRVLRLEDVSFPSAGTDLLEPRTAVALTEVLAAYRKVGPHVVRTLPAVLNPFSVAKLVAGVAFLMIVLGPPPWLWNRWGWFWMLWIGGPTMIGAALYLLLGGPSALRRQAPPDAPRSGGSGLLTTFTVTLLGGILLFGLRQLLLPDLQDHGVRVDLR